MSYVSGTIEGLSEEAEVFYCKVLRTLRDHEIRFLVGGSYAAHHYTGRIPHTKDLDIFLPPSQVDRALEALACSGLETEKTYPFWIAKACDGAHFVDVIYRAASGLWEVEEEWLGRGEPSELWGVAANVAGVEELIWTKAALMDRTRFDGNDVIHLLQARAHELDWERLRRLAGDNWRILLAHLTMFGYVYPDLIPLVPKHLLAELSLHLLSDRGEVAERDVSLCRGTLISNSQYIYDVEELGYHDARLQPWGRLTPEELRPWVDAVKRGDT
ncbi:MAG TPA: hypothetical protein VF168_08965 [Trueperaceae bacterium]